MVDIEIYMQQLLANLTAAFSDRLLYLGLQGSYRRGEAGPSSDMDIMVILDELTVDDMKRYRAIIAQMPEADRSCGFICGKEDMRHWNRGEICQLIHETKDYYGKLLDFAPSFTEEDIRSHIRVSADNLYHELCHRLIHRSEERNREGLRASYKTVFYILQNKYYLTQGSFYLTKKELTNHLEENDRAVMEWAARLKGEGEYSFSEAYGAIFSWCQELVRA